MCEFVSISEEMYIYIYIYFFFRLHKVQAGRVAHSACGTMLIMVFVPGAEAAAAGS